MHKLFGHIEKKENTQSLLLHHGLYINKENSRICSRKLFCFTFLWITWQGFYIRYKTSLNWGNWGSPIPLDCRTSRLLEGMFSVLRAADPPVSDWLCFAVTFWDKTSAFKEFTAVPFFPPPCLYHVTLSVTWHEIQYGIGFWHRG